MPEYIVELSFEYKSSYRVVAQNASWAADAAEAHDAARHVGTPTPPALAGIAVELLEDRAFADDLETRVFAADGTEIALP
jgi:hypothetical protein